MKFEHYKRETQVTTVKYFNDPQQAETYLLDKFYNNEIKDAARFEILIQANGLHSISLRTRENVVIESLKELP